MLSPRCCCRVAAPRRRRGVAAAPRRAAPPARRGGGALAGRALPLSARLIPVLGALLLSRWPAWRFTSNRVLHHRCSRRGRAGAAAPRDAR
ncbi:hypothetical protein SCE1572_31075 [Sorangium cellulosum So0157-2]|uniref:Uncharacterized protein n=1 Tax=Sorangium cellulosum So0157-2 TaxID=1254432 RepID=S4Y1B2_SORCE|nr:hypothetical protein SCE1572_31075 [Sorangium cellulosum So0157-2]